jgi:hypothetical protein
VRVPRRRRTQCQNARAHGSAPKTVALQVCLPLALLCGRAVAAAAAAAAAAAIAAAAAPAPTPARAPSLPFIEDLD